MVRSAAMILQRSRSAWKWIFSGYLLFPRDPAEANQQIRCLTQNCEAILCTRSDFSPKQACADNCARADSVQSIVPGSSCVINWPRSEARPPPGPAPWANQIRACVNTPGQLELLTAKVSEVDPPKIGMQYYPAGIIVPIGYKISEIYCAANDGYGAGWCVQGLGNHTRCDIQWSWPQYVRTEVFSDGRTNVEVVFYNESHNRWRQFKIYARIIPE